VFRVERSRVIIPIAYHVIDPDERTTVPRARIEQQTAVLNAAYAPYGVSFVTASVGRVVNPAWHTMLADSPVEIEAKAGLAISHELYLNFYIAGPRGIIRGQEANLLGFATFPWWLEIGNWDKRLDGVVVSVDSLPGGGGVFGEGATATHEIGHWLGLLHTFNDPTGGEDGCIPQGDEVADTPFERWPYGGPGEGHECPRNEAPTCPGALGRATANNMNNTDDRCMQEYTAQQDLRMRSMLQRYRPGFVARSPDIQRVEEQSNVLRSLGYQRQRIVR
jgi:hypothetical protein